MNSPVGIKVKQFFFLFARVPDLHSLHADLNPDPWLETFVDPDPVLKGAQA